MNGFIKKEKSEISNKLAKFTKDAFFEYVLPKIEKECPCVIGKFFVILTSSVAYGIADKYSDIDVFVIFPKHKDYLTYYKKLQTLIDSIEYPSNYYNICDKGIRFEFESFFKSDLEKLINNQSNNNWLNQTEWLLCWFINSVTIYDPNGICERNKKKLQYYPKKIIKFKANNNLLLLLKFRRIMRRMNDSYVFDVYYFKSIKRLMDLIYWCEGLYVPHSKWSFHITAYLETLGEHFHKEVSQILNSDKSSKILLIDKWIKILIDKYSSQLFINKRLKRYIDNGFYIEINKKSLVKSNLYFKDHIGPMKKLDLIFQYLNENGHNKEYYLIEETGLSYNRKVDYDKVLRVQYKYLQAQIDDHFFTHDEIYKKVVLYLVFIIWRKIRVATKAPLRKNFFNQKWYDLQVFEHFVELIAILEKRALVHEYYQKEFLIKDKKFKNISTSLLKSFELSQEEKNDFYWKCYNGLTNYILKKKILSEFQVKNPLIIQFEIEYWKYENLRH